MKQALILAAAVTIARSQSHDVDGVAAVDASGQARLGIAHQDDASYGSGIRHGDPSALPNSLGFSDDLAQLEVEHARERFEIKRKLHREKRERAQALFDQAEEARRLHSVEAPAILSMYREAADLRAGPGSAAAAGTLARMYEWGWDGEGDLVHYVPAAARRRSNGGGSGGGGSIGERLLSSSVGAWAAAHVPALNGLRDLSLDSFGVGWLTSLWAPLSSEGPGNHARHGDADAGGPDAAAASSSSSAAASDGEPSSPPHAHGAASRGLLVPVDLPTAVWWYNASASLGNASSQFTLGTLHAHGLFGVPHDDAAAVTLWYFAALGGSQAARLALGSRHATGDGVPKSCASAVLYLEGPAKARADAVAASHGLLQAAPQQAFTRLSDANVDSLASEALRRESPLLAYYHTNGACRS